MSSDRSTGRPYAATNDTVSSSKGKAVSQSNPNTDLLSQGLENVTLDGDSEWKVYGKKSKNNNNSRAGSSAAKPWAPPPTHNPNPRPWGNADVAPKPGRASGVNPWQGQNGNNNNNFRRNVNVNVNVAGRGNVRPQVYANANVGGLNNPWIRPPLENGWNWKAQVKDNEYVLEANEVNDDVDDDGDEEEEEDDDDGLEDTDDDLMSDDCDSDTSQKSHETRKKSKWFKKFFAMLDSLSVEQINEPERQWHCPACQGGPGAIDWYRGLQPLMTHAKTKGSKRVKIHRELALLLEEELRLRGTSVIPRGEAFNKWKGLKEEEKDHDIVWPPMVIIQNTQLELDENEKWIGMGNQELLDYFSTHAAVKARHAYGPKGHRGMSILIFEASAGGYFEAERLHKKFIDNGTDRDAWFANRRVLFLPGGHRQLFGYMANKDDLEAFNRHSQGKSKLRYEMRSYHEMVTNQIRQMSEDNQQLVYLKNKVVKEQRHSKALEESFGIVSEKLRKTEAENRIVRLRTKMQHEENKEEMNLQEQFFKDQMQIIHESRNAKEEDFERMQQEERAKAKESSKNSVNAEELRRRADDYLKFVEIQDKEMENFVEKKEKLLKVHEDNLAAMRRRHWEEEVAMEKKFDEQLAKLMQEYSPSHPQVNS